MIFDTTDSHYMMDWWTGVFGPFWWISMVLGWAVYIVVGITLAYYVHRDAIRRNIRNSEIWLIAVLIFNIFGALIYLLVRKNYELSPEMPVRK